jgi:hypothetical protein
MIDSTPPPQHPARLGGEVSWDPQRFVLPSGSRSSPTATGREEYPIAQNGLADGGHSLPAVTRRGNDHPGALSSSLAQLATRMPARRPSLRRTEHLPSRTFPPRVRQRTSKSQPSAKERIPVERGAKGAYSSTGGESRPVNDEVRVTYRAYRRNCKSLN